MYTPAGEIEKAPELGAIRSDENSVQLFSLEMKVSFPQCGNVLDPWTGTLVCLRVVLDMGASCADLEEDEECFQYSLARLRIFIVPYAIMEHMEDNVGLDTCQDAVFPPRLKKVRVHLVFPLLCTPLTARTMQMTIKPE